MNECTGYVPRRCSYTKQFIIASDRASIQISFSINSSNKREAEKKIYVISGNLRKQGKSDQVLNELIEYDEIA